MIKFNYVILNHYDNQRVVFETLLGHLNNQDYSEQDSLVALTFLYNLLNNPSIPKKFIDSLKADRVNKDVIILKNSHIVRYI